MKYIKEKRESGYDTIGIGLGAAYLFTTYISGSIYVPYWLNRGALLAFLVYGTLTVICNLVNGTFKPTYYTIWYGFLIAYTVITFPFSSYPSEITSNHFYQMIVCFFITTFLAEFIDSGKGFYWICWAYILSSFLMIYLLYRSGKLIGNYDERLGNEVMGNANVFATFMMYSVIYAFWLLVYIKYNLHIQVFLMVCITAIIYALMLSAGRKFFVVPFIFLYVLLLTNQKSEFALNVLRYTLLMGVLLFALYSVIMRVPILYNAIGIRMEQFINSVTGTGVADTSSIVRSQMRSAAIKGWMRKPIFGYGFNTFKYLRSPELLNGASHGYSHCNYAELLYNGGIVYTLFYYSFFLFTLRKTLADKLIDRRFRAFAVAAIVAQAVLDYGGVFYDIVATQVFLMLSAKASELTLEEDTNDVRCGESEI